MRNQDTFVEIEAFLTEFLQARGVDLVELKHHYEGRRLVLKALVDKPEGGIQLHECASMNSQIGALFDEKNVFEQPYVLEVSSPGLDRPLKVRKDFQRCIGKSARFFLQQPLDGKIEYLGTIQQALEDAVEVACEDNITRRIPYGIVNKAKQIVT